VVRKSLTSQLNCREFAHKIAVLYHAVPSKHFVKEHTNGAKVKLLLVGSGNIKGEFEGRGGREVLLAFAHLRQRYHNLELVVRSDVPTELKNRYQSMQNLRIIDQVVSREALEREFRSADIFIWPSHGTSPFVLLDAMTHELPVVAMNFWAIPEYIEDGKTGLLLHPSRQARQDGLVSPDYVDSPEFYKPSRDPDLEVVGEMVKRLSVLIEDSETRRRLGRGGRWEVEHGKFSIKARNEKLTQIFDEATSDHTLSRL
jgi:glycosyltransferase involved in cell wall biosynthesis